jgi:protein-S-isoprenylcysteine O-methyltransferase Ste14
VGRSRGLLFRWIGALLFVVSLAYFAFSYFWTFGAPRHDGGTTGAAAWNVTLFTAFALHHSLFARTRVRAWMTRIVPPDLERSVYVWIASVLFLVVCAAWRPVPGVAWQADGAALWTLRALQAAGLWLTIRSAAILDVWELAGLRPLRPEARGPGPAEFKTRGPYGWVRHPIYAGWMLFVFAASPMTMTRLVFAVVSSAYLLVAIPLEERTIRAASGGAYGRYMAAVRWKLVPGVY